MSLKTVIKAKIVKFTLNNYKSKICNKYRARFYVQYSQKKLVKAIYIAFPETYMYTSITLENVTFS